jgi:hypothetical protein
MQHNVFMDVFENIPERESVCVTFMRATRANRKKKKYVYIYTDLFSVVDLIFYSFRSDFSK